MGIKIIPIRRDSTPDFRRDRRRPGLRPLLKAAALFVLALLASGRYASAQDGGVVAPRTFTVQAFNAAACTADVFVVPDLSLNSHFIRYSTSGVINSLVIRLEGSFTGQNADYVSIVYADSTNTTAGGNYANIYMPFIRVRIVSCNGSGTVTAYYSGTWSLVPFPLSSFTPVPSAPFNCPLKEEIQFTGTSARIAQLADVTKSIHICHLSFALDTAADVTIQDGTGSACATGTGTLTGAYPGILSFIFQFPFNADLNTRTGRDLCLSLSTSATVGGVVIYAELE